MGLPEIPKPKDEVPVAPSDDEPLLTIDTDNKEITMSRQDTMKMRKVLTERGGVGCWLGVVGCWLTLFLVVFCVVAILGSYLVHTWFILGSSFLHISICFIVVLVHLFLTPLPIAHSIFLVSRFNHPHRRLQTPPQMNAEISGRNELKAKQRLLYAKELKKFANLEVERKECRSNLLEALDYENLIDLDEAMKEAAALGLEGKNR